MESSGGSEGGASENLQKAIDDLRAAGEKATGEVRENIDSAIQQIREASSSAASRAQDQVGDWRDALAKANENVRTELGKLGVRAQDSTDALDEIEQELKARREALS